MNQLREVVVVGLAGIGILAALRFCTGCSSGPTIPAYCTSEEAFTTALARCVDKASTLVQSRACRKDVHARCGFVETSSAGARP